MKLFNNQMKVKVSCENTIINICAFSILKQSAQRDRAYDR